MTFQKLGYARLVLRALAHEPLEKMAIWGAVKGVAGAAKGVGGYALGSATKSMGPVMGTLGVAGGALAVPSVVKGGINKGKGYRTGFDPRVQAYASEPIS